MAISVANATRHATADFPMLLIASLESLLSVKSPARRRYTPMPCGGLLLESTITCTGTNRSEHVNVRSSQSLSNRLRKTPAILMEKTVWRTVLAKKPGITRFLHVK
jgi:hypothetical protein